MSGSSAASVRTGQNEGVGRKEETEEEARQRFLLELEFVQCLANPTYIHCTGCFLLRFVILGSVSDSS